jgi:spore germination cell wall hydrolase CwlJ-like protein
MIMQTAIISVLMIALSATVFCSPSGASSMPQNAFCLALNIYHEARSKSLAGQVAVANVTLNRVKSEKFPNNICDVVFQKDQFSWYWDGKSDIPREKKAWETAKMVAMTMLDPESTIFDNTHGALFYHADYVNPFWSKVFEPVKKIGPHIFYVDNRS